MQIAFWFCHFSVEFDEFQHLYFAGRYEGDTGLVVRVENNRVVIISDLTMHEMEILPKDLQLCTDMASGVDSLGKFEWGDLVNLDAETVGVIVRLERENFHVLNMHGKYNNVSFFFFEQSC